MKRLPMRKIRDALRLRASGLPMRKIAASLGVGQSTLSDYLKRAARAGLVWPLPGSLTDAALEAMLFQPVGGPTRQVHAQPSWPAIHRELKRKNVTLSLLWEEYRAAHPEGYGYSRFCELYRRWEGRLAPTMRQHHVAGERMFVDYAGATLPVIDAATGAVRQAHLRRGARRVELPVRRGDLDADPAGLDRVARPDAGLVRRRARPDRVGQPEGRRHQGLFLRARGQPHLCRHGRPLRHRRGAGAAYKPRDKAKVEVAVQVAQRWIVARLRNRRFFSLAELNAAIRDLVVALNDRVTRHLGASRRQLFEDLERPALKPLPAAPYVYAQWQERRSGSTTMSRSTATTIRCPTGCCARRSGRA